MAREDSPLLLLEDWRLASQGASTGMEMLRLPVVPDEALFVAALLEGIWQEPRRRAPRRARAAQGTPKVFLKTLCFTIINLFIVP
jgi:hypothetical protein